MRVGRIGYINCYPVYGGIDRGVIPLPADLVTGTPSELNELLAAAELDVSVVSAVEYARNARDYVLLPDLAISCDGPVRSVALFSRRTVGQLDGRTVLLSASSRTWGLSHLDQLADAAALTCNVRRATCLQYLAGLDYALSYKHLAGLTDFFRRLAARGLVPDGSLRFLQVA